MKDDDFFSSLSRMADEFNRLVSPLIDQLKIKDLWHEIESPVLRVAKMRDDVLPGVTAFDLSLANRLRMLIDPYQSILDNMSAIETMMGTRFAELVRPQTKTKINGSFRTWCLHKFCMTTAVVA